MTTLLGIIAAVLIAFVVGSFFMGIHDRSNQPCDYFKDTTLQDVPARCAKEYR